MKQILIITIILALFCSINATVSAIEIDIDAGDTLCYDTNVTNTNGYRALYEFYIDVSPDAEGFNITIIPESYEFDSGETITVMICVNSSIATAPEAYNFFLKYNITNLEGVSGGDNTGDDGDGNDDSSNWQPPGDDIVPPDIPPYVPPDYPDFINVIRYTNDKVTQGIPFLGICGLIAIVALMLILLIYKKNKRGKNNENKQK